MKAQIPGDNLIVALDIGTTKICVLVAQRGIGNSITILGIGKAQSHGVARGVIVDIGQAVQAIKLAVKEAELMAECKIESVYIGVSGSHIQSINSQGMIPIKGGRIRPHDLLSVIAASKAIIIPEGQQILHVLPQYYTIDSQHRVMDPIGMYGVRLEVQTHIITGALAAVQNLVRCCQMAGVRVIDVILEPLASAFAVLSQDERELGVAMLDIGGGTSDFAIYQYNAIAHTKVIPVAGNHVTHDIALCLRTTLKDAERVKLEFGRSCMISPAKEQEFSAEMVHGAEHRAIKERELIAVIQPRIEELMLMVRKEITKNSFATSIPAGLVLTGGGSLLQGIKESAEAIVQVPVRVGKPQLVVIFKELLENPIYATSYGLLLYVIKQNKKGAMDYLAGPLISRIFGRMKSWMIDFF